MKNTILFAIYEIFERWNTGLDLACRSGCSSCCTRNVTITAVEGAAILRFAQQHQLSLWLAERLVCPEPHHPPRLTTNDFAKACLGGKEVDGDGHYNLSPCPFLENNLCRIYPVRPFGCRLFVSTESCSASRPAQVSDSYFEAATAVSQLIEHLGQKEYWGNMLDVLPAMLDCSEFAEIAEQVSTTQVIDARLRTLTAKPLPGFLISQENSAEVIPLLQRIFDAEVGGRRVEDILNGN